MEPARARSRAWWAYSEYVVFTLGIVLLLLTAYLIVIAPGLFAVDLPGALLGIAAFLIGLAILDRLPRDVEVGDDGVEFRYFLSRVALKWDQLAPPTPVGKGFVAFRAVSGARGVWGSLTVTAAQGRQILAHPKSPRFELSDDLANVLRG
ncbi:MAG TPA: hypothetical protein VK455_07000 [Thermoplasmata archaeon]|nr:hypothetical protein [Thermoplasmata archaeon]